MIDNPRIVRSTTHEDHILTGLIVSKQFCTEVIPLLDIKHIKLTYLRPMVSQCIEYFIQYGEPPIEQAQALYDLAAVDMEPRDAELLEITLGKIAEDYERAKASFNVDFYIQAALTHIRKSALEDLSSIIVGKLRQGDVDGALTEVATFSKVDRISMDYVQGDNLDRFAEFFTPDTEPPLLEMPGALGKFMGPFERTWLIAYAAPPKGGKSFFMLETAIQALAYKRNTVVFSHEMSEKQWMERLFDTISDRSRKGLLEFTRPFVDCVMNRDGTCNVPARVNKEAYSRGTNPEYRACTECRCIAGGPFSSCIVLAPVKMVVADGTYARKKLKSFGSHYGRHLIFKAYPAFTANSRVMNGFLDRVIAYQRFIPDVIVSDYAEAQAPEELVGMRDTREYVNATWQALKQMAQKRNALVVTGSQGNRSSMSKDVMQGGDIADDYRKLAIVDAIFGLSQSDIDRQVGITRVNIMRHRERGSVEHVCCSVLQHLGTGKVYLDSFVGTVGENGALKM